MKTKAASLLILLVLCIFLHPFSASSTDRISGTTDDIIAFKVEDSECNDISQWIIAELPKGAGVDSEWYAIALSQLGYTDFSAYEAALLQYISENNVASASARERLAAALCAVGSESPIIPEFLDSSIDKQGIMSRVFGLHLINNGYTCRYSAYEVVDMLLSMQLADGGWSLFGQYGDADVTAMTVQAMAPYISRNTVKSAIEKALRFLSEKQLPDGGFSSMGKANSESAAQVIITLSALNIDCLTDSRFIKNGCSALDAMLKYRLSDGSFCHDESGVFSEISTVQALCALTAYQRMTNEKGSLWIFDNRKAPQTPQTVTTVATTAVTSSAAISETSSDVSASITTVSEITDTSTSSSQTETVSVTESMLLSASKSTTTSTAAVTVASATDGSPKNHGYKPIAVIIAITAAAVISLVLFITGKRSPKNFIAVGIVGAALIAVILLTDISKPEDYYGKTSVKENAVGTVTLTIRCDAVSGRADHIPENGIILSETDFEIEKGDTVQDILIEAAKAHTIKLNTDGNGYISGIASVHEFDFGDLSGWIYTVNGESASVGCDQFTLNDGDRISWLYTLELGQDIEEVYGDEIL
ncbi:MAG: DUF4430 domain-containing protein [Ruminococcus sp.]|nr:DUF4430 domain-containing protein [Ruminococcus sp.]